VPQVRILNLGFRLFSALFAFSFSKVLASAGAERQAMPTSAQSILSIVMFALLGASLFYFVRKKLD